MEIKELYEAIKVAREMSNAEITAYPVSIRPAIEGKIRSAQASLRNLENQYRDQIVSQIALISVSGKYAKEFAEIAQSKFKTLSFDYISLVERIASSVISRGGRDFYDSHEHWMVMDELNQIKLKYKLASIPPLTAKFSQKNLRESLIDSLGSTYSGSLYSAVLRGDIGIAALEAGFTGKVLPVIIYNYIEPVDERIVKKPVANIEANSKPTEKLVKEQLVKVKTNLKSKDQMTQ